MKKVLALLLLCNGAVAQQSFNATNKLGYKLSVDTPPGNPEKFTTTIYQNNKRLFTVPYKPITDEN
ncbi:hypothetical protein LZZ85_13070 [Terrimonas sp. NA20]|uniref:Uncharacterized protein n=1 Tax=Terrimonas ginsenosidimutans TaxID=2908004 RepID=A0ABS9KSH5_9BACT|nr:hypothetical protein [Terrimonas ginsenosidimutans]MCG2615225.1 hypothetical protein [Terrimonas ginsenosidimutans]